MQQRGISESLMKAMIVQLTILALVEGAIGYVFYYFSTNPEYYESEDCVYLRRYSYIFGLGALIICVVKMFACTFGEFRERPDALAESTTCCSLLTISFYIVLWILLLVALGFDEECGQLRQLVIIMLTVMVIGICLTCCSQFCVLTASFIIIDQQNRVGQ